MFYNYGLLHCCVIEQINDDDAADDDQIKLNQIYLP